MLTALLAIAILGAGTSARATAAVHESSADFRGPSFRVHAELQYDRFSKKPDVWLEFEERNAHGTVTKFTATSLAARYSEAQWRLQAAPVSRVDDETVFIYYGFDLKTGEYDGNHSVALIFHLPANQLPEPIMEMISKNFPASISRDNAGKPVYVKAVLCRITENQVYPVAAFDDERSLPWRLPATP